MTTWPSEALRDAFLRRWYSNPRPAAPDTTMEGQINALQENHMTTRELTGHRINPANDKLTIKVVDEPGAGGANHAYLIQGGDFLSNPAASVLANHNGLRVQFQQGPIAENGVNGLTQEVLLEILIDRLQSFQAGQYSCRENAVALTHLETAKLWLHKRTMDRMARGVEGTHQK